MNSSKMLEENEFRFRDLRFDNNLPEGRQLGPPLRVHDRKVQSVIN
jgi:hypothetical protein